MAWNFPAAAYDLLSDPAKRLAREGAFLASRLRPGIRVLDAACGTGVHAQWCARAGAEVDACDLSPAMVDRARTVRGDPHIRYAVGNLCTPPPGPYDLILCLGNTLPLLGGPEMLRQALGALHRVLAPGGTLILHLLHAERPGETPVTVVREGEIDGRSAVVTKTMLRRGAETLLSLVLFLRDGTGGWTSATETAVLREIGRKELAAALAEAGFGAVLWFGGLNGSPCGPESVDLVAVATKP